ncbi:MAG: phosphoribosyl-ATP diphosphatase [Deltaproteobacteria bacterium]|nr:phosphoribosyl-ATP diphosphatase [Deltaproteobacteria bacterium]
MLIPVFPFAACPRDRATDRRAASEGPWWLAPLAAPRAVELGEEPLTTIETDVLVELVRERPTHVLRCRDITLVTRLLDEGAISVVVEPDIAATLPAEIPPKRIGLWADRAGDVAKALAAATIWTTDRTCANEDSRERVVMIDAASFDPAAAPAGTVAIRDAHRCPPDHEATAFCARIACDRNANLWTAICDDLGALVAWGWSNPDSIRRSMTERRAYLSADVASPPVWLGGALVAVQIDHGGRALRYLVAGPRVDAAWPNRWPEREGFAELYARLRERVHEAPPGSYTRRLLDTPDMLRGKLLEEAAELAAASGAADVRGEAADVLYFAWVALAREGVSPGEVEAEFARRALRLNRRPGDVKPPWAKGTNR